MNRSANYLLAVVLASQAMACRPAEPTVEPGPALDVARERASYVDWLEHSPISPLRAVTRVALTETIRIGPPTSDIPLDDMTEHRLIPGHGVATLETDSGRRMVAPYVPVELGGYRLSLQGERDKPVVMMFGPPSEGAKAPMYYPIDSSLVFEVEIGRSKRRATRMLALDGIEVEGTIVGSVSVPLGEGGISLEVRHVPDPGTEESALEIFFRDETNEGDTYPAGRFVALEPIAGDRFRLDFNRARSPFCAYSTVYPCPVPWRGNMIKARVEAGERYQVTSN